MPFLDKEEHDACGIVAVVEKGVAATRENVERVVAALDQMRHRAGFVLEEGDGSGILMDIPRIVWAERLHAAGLDENAAWAETFAVGHLIATDAAKLDTAALVSRVRELAERSGFVFLCNAVDRVNRDVLGRGGRAEGVHFLQFGWTAPGASRAECDKACFELALALEQELPVHVASLSTSTTVYKVRGDSATLRAYFHDFDHPGFISRVSIGHNRYSTNTTTSSERVQPFSLLGHNGELNTIHRLREETGMLAIPTVPGGSDSQDLDRFLQALIHVYGYSLLEAMELAFPPIINEIKQLPGHLQDLYMYNRSLWGPFAQGPAGIVSRHGKEAVFSVDALGLRPLWMVETEASLVFSSEQGVVALQDMIHDPKALAPGEKMYLQLPEDEPTVVHDYPSAQEICHDRMAKRHTYKGYGHALLFGGPVVTDPVHLTPMRLHEPNREARMVAFGWDLEDTRLLEAQASTGAEPIRSLGFDGPLAALADQRQNVADFLKETVAVVTNPAIDREREVEHFSTRVVLGRRPHIAGGSIQGRRMEMQSPLLLGGHSLEEPDRYRATAHKLGTQLFEDVLRYFADGAQSVAELYPRVLPDESLPEALERLREETLAAVSQDAALIVVDDRFAFDDGATFVDPTLALSLVHKTLREARKEGLSVRRQVSLIVRSGAIRNLHDIAVLVGLGADALCPYLYFEGAHAIDGYKGIENAYSALTKGLEKVISTLGIHELRGYDRLFSGVGLGRDVAELLEVKSFFDEMATGGSLSAFLETARARAAALANPKATLPRPYQLWPRIWKSAGDAAAGSGSYDVYTQKLRELEASQPISLRHLLDVQVSSDGSSDRAVDLSVGEHALPFLISSMSFGSQGETAFRAYAIAAQELDMISLNGEGGEIKDMLGKYAKNRGHQIASGRFGVNAELCNSVDLLEIKIGQGAKPGEGGHLPGSKVSAKVAAARNARQGTDLISPSNNHDIYSIEDLAQMIDELKTVNPRAKVSVKIPVVPGIGTIAVGIAKAGADVIAVSGFDGGTGAARAHALKHVGLPVEIGVKLAHEALLAAGLRDVVEIWCDGGMKSGLDAVKMVLLGANRIGFGTMAMVAVGCTSCRACHKDTCHVGIATQIESVEQATAHGLKAFVPRELDLAVAQLTRFFRGVAGEVRAVVAALGASSLQSLVGRSELLQQTRGLERLDLRDLILHHVEEAYTFRQLTARESAVGAESLTVALAQQAHQALAAGSESLQFGADRVHSGERVIGGMLSGTVVRTRIRDRRKSLERASVRLVSGSVVGNGFAAYNAAGVHLRVEGGAQDGVGKGAIGGKVIVLKGVNRDGVRVNGSVGKGLAYGAQHGLFIIQGNADARAGIRLSGADIVIGGEVTTALDDARGSLAARANVKGFAFEYMTAGRALLLGDPGPWICSGMTGGAVYLRLQPAMGLTTDALRRRIAKGAKVALMRLNSAGVSDVQELLGLYQRELTRSGQWEEAQRLAPLMERPEEHFLVIRASSEQTDQDIATE
ncbi:MAG: glutamate synthase-related protein [Firmicutes bacterium]|nr:glutamate synthase-related protein [Bacillota bacterium]